MIDIINEVVSLTEGKLGTRLSTGQRREVIEAVALHYGGERHYLPKLPKLVAQVRVEALGTGASTADMAAAIGKSARWVRKITRGR